MKLFPDDSVNGGQPSEISDKLLGLTQPLKRIEDLAPIPTMVPVTLHPTDNDKRKVQMRFDFKDHTRMLGKREQPVPIKDQWAEKTKLLDERMARKKFEDALMDDRYSNTLHEDFKDYQ